MISIQLRSTQNYSVANGVKIVVYGRAGRGKTRLCATCPTPVIFSAESGLLSLAAYNLPYYEIKTVGDLRDAYTWARSSAEARQFESICLDSISEIAEVSLAAAQAGKKDGRMAYGEMITDVTKVIKDFRDLAGKHVYMSAKEERNVDAQGISTNGPSMPGKKLGQAVPYFPDEIFQADIDPVGGYYYLRCKPDFSNDAKDRSGVLDEKEPPDLGHIIRKIQQGLQPRMPT